MRLVTDRHVADYPTLAAAEDREQLLADAGALYSWVDRHPFATENRLRARAEADGIGADRANAALAFLREVGRLVAVPEEELLESLALTIPRDIREWTLDELQRLAKLLDVPGRSSLNRDELVTAIVELPNVVVVAEGEALEPPAPEPGPPAITSGPAVVADRKSVV